MLKKELIFIVKDAIERQAPTQDGLKFSHPQDIAFHLAMAYEKAVIDFYSIPEYSKNYDLDYFTKSYEKTVKEDSYGNLYVDLPGQPIPLPEGQAIKSLIPTGSSTNIVRISEAEWMNLVNLEAFCCSPWPFCYPDIYNKRIVLQGNRSEYKLLDKIIVKIVPKFTEFSNTEEINTPSGDYSITQMVMQNMGLRPTDNTNDDGR